MHLHLKGSYGLKNDYFFNGGKVKQSREASIRGTPLYFLHFSGGLFLNGLLFEGASVQVYTPYNSKYNGLRLGVTYPLNLLLLLVLPSGWFSVLRQLYSSIY